MHDPVVIVSAARTPMGGFRGALAGKTAPELGAAAIAAALSRADIAPQSVDQALMGCVLSAGLGQAPARQAALGAAIPDSTPCTTISKVCGSGMMAVMLAHDMIRADTADLVVAGGMESMSNAPYLLDKARGGYRLGHGKIMDHMFLDGLEDAYDRGRLMGTFAEDTAEHFQFTRADQDEFALRSLARARQAQAAGSFVREIVPVDTGADAPVSTDEGPVLAKPEKIPKLKPAFRANGTVTPANSSSISDGGAALVLSRRSLADQRGLPIRAIIRGHASHAQAPAWFTTAPAPAIRKLAGRIGWDLADIDLFEINEAFAVVTMATQRELGLPDDKVNVHGGACALGHPIGASGARILVTLLHAMEERDVRRGIASLCIGGGEATAVAIERVS